MKTLNQMHFDIKHKEAAVTAALKFKPNGWTDADLLALEKARAELKSAEFAYKMAISDALAGRYGASFSTLPAAPSIAQDGQKSEADHG